MSGRVTLTSFGHKVLNGSSNRGAERLELHHLEPASLGRAVAIERDIVAEGIALAGTAIVTGRVHVHGHLVGVVGRHSVEDQFGAPAVRRARVQGDLAACGIASGRVSTAALKHVVRNSARSRRLVRVEDQRVARPSRRDTAVQGNTEAVWVAARVRWSATYACSPMRQQRRHTHINYTGYTVLLNM